MVLLGVLLALSLVTIVTVLVSCEAQAQAAAGSIQELRLPSSEQARFEAIVAPLLADPEFGRNLR